MNEIKQLPSTNCNVYNSDSSGTFAQRIKYFKNQIFPLTKLFFDRLGNSIQIWSVPESRPMVVLQRPDGSTCFIPPDKIYNPLNPTDDPVTLHNRLLTAPDCKWDIVIKENGRAEIWPHLEAQGWREAIPKDSQDLSGVARLARGKTREEMCSWFYRNGYRFQPSTKHETPKVEIHFQSGGYAGKYRADDHETIRNLLRQGGYIKEVHHDASTQKEISSRFIGRGLCFRHPQDKTNTDFNVDYTKAQRKENNTWDAEKEGGYHIDVHRFGKSDKIRVSTKETYAANYNARKDGQKVRYEIYIPPGRPFPTHPGSKQFEKILQQTKLTDSYNANHRGNPVPEKGMTGGKIGGVACSSDYIEGLFDSPESLFEEKHFFYLQTPDGQFPFTNDELRQIIRELTIGIYVHETIPFFSLHFRQDSADLFPVIHPVYEHTLVGRVISMLDYFMKGYLNGGVFSEAFIDRWHKNPNWKAQSQSALEELIDFEQYCSTLKGEDQRYISLKSITASLSANSIFKKMLNMLFHTEDKLESDALTQFEGFRNSFRIIAKQNSFKKSGSVFLIDADFDIEYTIEPSPQYEEELSNHQRKYGSLPNSYSKLVSAFEIMKKQIHDHMQNIPLCKNYFSMLSIIHFFSCYLSTLKKHRKMPFLPPVNPTNQKGCPPLFPHLPITIHDKEALHVNVRGVFYKAKNDFAALFENYFLDLYTHLRNGHALKKFESEKKVQILNVLQVEMEKNILSNSSPAFRSFIEKNKKEFHLSDLSNEFSQQLLAQLLEPFSVCMQQYLSISSDRRVSKHEMIRLFLDQVKEAFSQQLVEISKPIPYKSTVLNSQVKKSEVDKNKRIVGGCGLRLEKKGVEPSEKCDHIQQNNWQILSHLEPESWQKVEIPGSQGTLFGLEIGDVPYDFPDDYAWMETFLFASTDDKNLDRANEMIRIQETIDAKDKKSFMTNISTVKADELTKMKDRNGATLLCYAAMSEDPFYVETLLKWLSPLTPDDHGYLPVHYAAMKDRVESLKVLIAKAPGTLQSTSKNGSTPLTVAIQHGAIATVSLCLEKNPSLTLLTDGYTDLHCALHAGNREIISLLFKYTQAITPCLNICSEEGGTPLMLACELDDPEIVQSLIDKGADASIKRRDGITAMEIACKRNCLPVLEVLLCKATPSATVIESALRESSIEIVAAIAKHVKNFAEYKNAWKDTPAHIAIRHGNLLAAFYLANAFPAMFKTQNQEHKTPLSLALSSNAWDLVDTLFTQHAIIPEIGDLLSAHYHPLAKKILNQMKLEPSKLQDYLRIAARPGNRAIITLILNHKDIDIQKIKESERLNILRLLVLSDASLFFKQVISENPSLLSTKLEDGKTLAYLAAENQSERVLLFLLNRMKENKVSLHHHFGDRHLYYPILERGNLKMIEQILSLFPDLVSVSLDKKETKPSHLAAQLGLDTVLELLISNGADIGSLDQQQHSPLYYAVMMRHEEVVACLIKKNGHTEASNLYEAATEDDKILELLLQAKPSQKILDQALFMAIERHHERAVLRLHAHGATFTHIYNGWTPLLLASQTGQSTLLLKIIEDLSKNAPTQLKFITPEGNSALHLACQEGHIGCVLLLLEAGFDINQKNNQKKTPLDLAYDKKGLMRLLKSPIEGQHHIEKYTKALEKGKSQEIESLFHLFSETETLPFPLENRMIHASPLQLAIRCAMDLTQELFLKWLPSYSKNINLPDGDGDTIAHLLIRQGISPLCISKLDLGVSNHRGQTPVHIAAQFASESLLQELIKVLPTSIHDPDLEGRTPIFYAIESKDEKKLALLIKNGAHLNHYDKKQFTPLLFAIQQGFLNGVKMLVEAGADLNQSGTIKKVSPLLASIIGKHTEMTRYLILKGASTEFPTEEGILPIHVVAEMGNLALLRLLSMNRQSLLARDDHGRRAIHYAALHGQTDALAYLTQLDEKAIHYSVEKQEKDINRKNDIADVLEQTTPLHLAALSGGPSTVDWLLKHWADPEALTKEKKYPLFFGMQSPAANSMLQLFDPYQVTQETDNLLSFLTESIRHDYVDAMKSLYGKGIPINWEILEKSTGLHVASYCGALHCTAYLLQNGADPMLPNDEGKNAFEIAASKGFHEQFKLLLQHGQPDLDAPYYYGQTLLHLAAQKGHFNNVLVLIKLGALLNCVDFMGCTPLYLAVKENRLEIAKLLLSLGADTSLKSKFDKTAKEVSTSSAMKKLFHDFDTASKQCDPTDSPLHFAVRMNSHHATMLLLEDEEVNVKNQRGITPLHLAVENEYFEIVLLLLQKGANPQIADGKHQTPLHIAEKKEPIIKEKMLKILNKI